MSSRIKDLLARDSFTSEVAMDSSADPDHLLIIRFRAGDLFAFEALVEKYKRPIINLATNILRDIHEAHDIAQNVFLRAYQALAGFKFSCRTSTWFHTITRNLCLNELRRRSRQRVCSFNQENASAFGSVDQFEDKGTLPASEVILQEELSNKIEEALTALPEPQRTAIVLCKDRQLSYQDIARILGISVPATKSLIHRGRGALKRKLKPWLIHETIAQTGRSIPSHAQTTGGALAAGSKLCLSSGNTQSGGHVT